MTGEYERQLVRIFRATDRWIAQRAVSSGSATVGELPDVTFAERGFAFAGELKTTSQGHVYLEPEEIEQLQDYCEAYDMVPVAIGWFKGEKAYYVWRPDEMDRTDSGNYSGGPDDSNWAAKIADPDGAADGIYPADLEGFMLLHALRGKLTGPITAAPGGDDGD